MEQNWNRNGAGTEQNWKGNGAGMERERNVNGTEMEWEWNGSGMEQKWNKNSMDGQWKLSSGYLACYTIVYKLGALNRASIVHPLKLCSISVPFPFYSIPAPFPLHSRSSSVLFPFFSCSISVLFVINFHLNSVQLNRTAMERNGNWKEQMSWPYIYLACSFFTEKDF